MRDQSLRALRAGDKFPKGGTYFLGNLAKAGDIWGGGRHISFDTSVLIQIV